MLHAPCSPMATGHGQDPAHRSPNIPPAPPSAGDGLHCVEIQLLHCMASRRYGPPAAARWLAWLGWKGGRGGESPVLNRDWGMSNGGGQWHGERQTGKRCLRCRRPSFQARPLGADQQERARRRETSTGFSVRVHVPSSTPWLSLAAMDSRNWPPPSAVGLAQSRNCDSASPEGSGAGEPPHGPPFPPCTPSLPAVPLPGWFPPV